jgi:hypothetical protein
MNSNRDEALVALLLEKSADKRPAFLEAVCDGDGALRQRLESLLVAHEQPETLLATQAAAARPTIKLELADAPDEAVGQTLGRYKLLERVGEGGCGVVYVAEQTEPVRRRVAQKVIKLGMDTKQVVARFEAERQALAMMDHPNIAKVLDAGTTEVGRPFFVMELVRGIKITNYCDQANLTTKETARSVHQGLPGHPARAPEGDHPSRHQAVEHSRYAARRGAGAEGDRLRHRQGDRRPADGRDGLHAIAPVHRHAGLHEPGASGDERLGHRHTQRHLQPGRVAL